MVKKKKSYIKQMRDVNSFVLGGSLIQSNAQMLAPGALDWEHGHGLRDAGMGTLTVAIAAPMSGVAFDAIENISKSRNMFKKKKKR